MIDLIKKIKKADMFIAFFVISFGILTAVLLNPLKNSSTNVVALIEVDGKEYATYSLDNLPKTIDVNTKFGHNLVVFDSNGVKVAKSDCKDQIEVKSGYINKAGQMLVCLPNRLVIKLVGKGREVDEVTY